MATDRIYSPLDYPNEGGEDLEKIFKNAAVSLEDDYGIMLPHEAAYTVFLVSMDFMARFIGDHPDKVINLSSYGKLFINTRESEGGEKSGNRVPVFELGESFKLGIKNDDDTEEDE